VLTIAPTTEAMDAHSPGLARSIVRYNAIVADAVRAAGGPQVQLVDVHAAIVGQLGGVEQYVNPMDGHHITRVGHALYARLLLERELERNGG
jgi:hypothetical protein